MTWGDDSKAGWFNPAKMAYGGPESGEDERKAFEISVAQGAILFDTAEMYSKGGSESRLGELSDGKEVIIASKFPPSPFSNPSTLPNELEASLRRLRRSSIDLFQHHFPTSDKAIPKVMNLMADAFAAGKIRAIGVSNYSAAQMRLAYRVLADRGIPLASNQVQYSLLHRKPEADGVLDACLELGVTLIAYMPLASGALTGKYSLSHPPRGIRKWTPVFSKKSLAKLEPVLSALKLLGGKYDKTLSQVALRWLMENPAVLPIPGAKNASQASSNAGALTFRLTPEEVRELGELTLAWRK